MRVSKLLRRLAIVLFIGCIVIFSIDLLKILKVNLDFLGMQSTDRISSSSENEKIRYEPTDYVIANKDEVLAEIKNITIDFKEEYINSNKKTNLFEIANIDKLQGFFYEYQKYAVVKYKLLNIIEDLPKLHSTTKNYTDSQLNDYLKNNSTHIEKCYGITSNDKFVELAKSLSFLGSGKTDMAIILDATVDYDYDDDTLEFYIQLVSENNKSQNYFVKADYYKSTDNQVTPYVSFSVNK